MTKIDEIFSHEADNGAKGSLGIDQKGQLYWNKKRVITKQEVALNVWVNIAVVVSAGATLIMAVFSILEYCLKISKGC